MRPSGPQAEIKIPAAMRAAMRVAINMSVIIMFVSVIMGMAIVAMTVTVAVAVILTEATRSAARNKIAFPTTADSAHDSCSLQKAKSGRTLSDLDLLDPHFGAAARLHPGRPAVRAQVI